MPNARQTSLIPSPSSSRATNRRRSSITEHSFHGIHTSPERGSGVTHVSGTICYLCLGSVRGWRLSALRSTTVRLGATLSWRVGELVDKPGQTRGCARRQSAQSLGGEGDPMKFMLLMLPTVPGTLEDRKRLRPIGRNNERYQQMLEELRKLVVFADEVGFDVFATTEHHFHSEGYETSVAPLMLYTDLAARTKRIKFSPLGLVLPSWDPIRAAEEIAILDHLT